MGRPVASCYKEQCNAYRRLWNLDDTVNVKQGKNLLNLKEKKMSCLPLFQ